MSVFEAIFDKIAWVTGKLIVIAGAVILVLVVMLGLFVGWLVWEARQHSAEKEVRRAAKEVRQAACHFIPTIIVEIGDNVVALPAALRVGFRRQKSKIAGAEPSADAELYGDEKKGFCLDGPQIAAIPINRISFSYGGEFGEFAKANQFPGRFYSGEITRGRSLSGKYGPPEIDLLTEKPEEMIIYNTPGAAPRNNGPRLSVVMRGVSDSGFRSSATCTFWRKSEGTIRPGRWTCEYRIRDFKKGVNYSYTFLDLFQEELDLEWVAQQSDLIVEKLRWLLAELSVDAPGNIARPSTQHDL